MNSTQIALNLKNILALLLVVLFTSAPVFGDMAYGKMASMAPPIPLKPFPVTQVIDYYKKKPKLTSDEASIFKLVLLSQDVFGKKEYNVSEHLKTEKEKVESLTLMNVAMIFQQDIQKRPNWHERLSENQLAKLKDSSEVIKNTLTENSAAWAWVCYQTGQEAEAKKILTAKFEETYSAVMKMTGVYNHGTSPLNESEDLAKYLKPMSTHDEIKANEAKIKKMRTHLSNLPDMQIMT